MAVAESYPLVRKTLYLHTATKWHHAGRALNGARGNTGSTHKAAMSIPRTPEPTSQLCPSLSVVPLPTGNANAKFRHDPAVDKAAQSTKKRAPQQTTAMRQFWAGLTVGLSAAGQVASERGR